MINTPGGVILIQFFEWLFIPSNRFKGVIILALPFSLIVFFRATNVLCCVKKVFKWRFPTEDFSSQTEPLFHEQNCYDFQILVAIAMI